jgi:NTP pyrophosphatase (non-canonical NTP hydrolase)
VKKATIKRIREFTIDRDWDQFHSPANLAKSISIEANELLECFQWSDTDYKINEVKDELADIIVYCRNMLDKLNLDEDDIVNEKLNKNEKKYPVSKSKSNSKKYTEFK